MAGLPRFTPTYHHKPYPSIDPRRPELSLKGKAAVITGGASGIGRATCHALATAGVDHLIILDQDTEGMFSVRRELNSTFPTLVVHTFRVDITDKRSIDEALRHASESDVRGPFDILINNAAAQSVRTPIDSSDPDDWWRGININVKGPYNVTRAFLPYARDNAVVVNISSCLAHLSDTGDAGLVGQSAYSAAKIAITRTMEILQAERDDLKVINIHPGLVPTRMAAISGNLDVSNDDVNLPAGFIVWVISQEADFLKGRMVWANWDVDELVEKKHEIINNDLLKLTLRGI